MIRGELFGRVGDRNWFLVCCRRGCGSFSMLLVVFRGIRDGGGGGRICWGVSVGVGDK